MVFSLLQSRPDLKMVAVRLKGSLVIKLPKQVLSEVRRKCQILKVSCGVSAASLTSDKGSFVESHHLHK